MKLIIQIACGILLARFLIAFFESPALWKAIKLWLKLLYVVVMIPITCAKWLLKGTGALCRWIDGPRKRYGLKLSLYYIALSVPALSGFVVPCHLVMVPNAPITSADHPSLVNFLFMIADASMLLSILLGFSCAVAYHTGDTGERKPGAAGDVRPSRERSWPW